MFHSCTIFEAYQIRARCNWPQLLRCSCQGSFCLSVCLFVCLFFGEANKIKLKNDKFPTFFFSIIFHILLPRLHYFS